MFEWEFEHLQKMSIITKEFLATQLRELHWQEQSEKQPLTLKVQSGITPTKNIKLPVNKKIYRVCPL